MGHELRTPLTAVLGFAEMLPADRVEMVDFIAREAFDLSRIIDDLLVAARIEIGSRTPPNERLGGRSPGR